MSKPCLNIYQTFVTGLLLFISLSACNAVPATPTPTKTPLPDREVETYRVYSALIQAKYVGGGIERIVIEEETGHHFNESTLESIQHTFKLKRDILDDFIAQNRTPRFLEDVFKLNVEVVLFDEVEAKGVFSPEDYAWVTFHEKYPNSQGLIKLSGVGFNKDMTRALVQVGIERCVDCGEGWIFLLENRNGNWVVVGEEILWVS
jgi:hypothetical protein